MLVVYLGYLGVDAPSEVAAARRLFEQSEKVASVRQNSVSREPAPT